MQPLTGAFARVAFILAAVLVAGPVRADQTRIRVNLVTPDGIGAAIGTIRAVDTKLGLRLTPLLKSLAPGPHGLHVHENGDCNAAEIGGRKLAAGAAGGHFDPAQSRLHQGPEGKGHLGDLPVLAVDKDGIARTAVTAPRLKLAEIKGRAIVIHAGGDNYSDQPEPLGGGGARVACGTIR